MTPEEEQLVEREFVARQEMAARRRAFCRKVFFAGLTAALGAGFLRGIHFGPLLGFVLTFLWVTSILVYVGTGVFSDTFAKETDLRWQLNPWQEALNHLSDGRTQVEAIALLAALPLARMLGMFLYYTLR